MPSIDCCTRVAARNMICCDGTVSDRLRTKNPLRAKSNFLSRFKLIWVVQLSARKYSAFHPTQISGNFRASRPGKRGV
ncbi:hypothetical protein, partial [Bradyrhizobium lablabi]|uniref:hypothetical protein n=1 Tax=Bradyrhizobium lablabi TaxID=722472 RepID=UPI001AECE1C9